MTIETKADLQHMGQWVFKDAPEWVESAAVDKNGQAYRYGGPLEGLYVEQDAWINEYCQTVQRIDGVFDATNWQHSAIARDRSSPSTEVQEAVDRTSDAFQRLNVALKKHNNDNQRLKTEAQCDKEAWKKQAFINNEQYELAKMSITNLRAVIIELAATLHAADGNARISITSSELLELLHSNEDHLDIAF